MKSEVEKKKKIPLAFRFNKSNKVIDLSDENTLNHYREQEQKRKKVEALLKDFNPDVHVIVTKDQLDITNQLQALSGMAKTLQDVKEDVQFVKQRYLTPNQKKVKSNPTEEEISLRRKAQWLKQGKKV